MKRVSQLGVGLWGNQSGAEKQSVQKGESDISEVRSETPKWSVVNEIFEHGVKTQSNEDDGQIS